MSDTRGQLLIDLQRIEENQYQLNEGEKLWDFVTLMLQYIGDPQPELRDELIYPTFYEWIIKEQLFNETELRDILSVVIDEQHLFYHIGSQDDQTVFTRTFSVLVVALLVQRHRLQPYLDNSGFLHLKHSLIRYYSEEKDLRGYLAEGGWAHSAAHGADALVEMVLCRESDAAVQQEVLVAVQGMLYNELHIFNEEEDERIASIVDTMIANELLPQQSIADWIGNLEQCCSWPRSRSQVIARVNTKNCLRSLYFRLKHFNRGMDIMEAILKTEVRLNKFTQ